jgi:hypothetical protein
MRQRVILLKRILLGAWALWWTIVFASNLADVGRVLQVLPDWWRFASGNFSAIESTTARYGAGVIVWEASGSLLFWHAWWRYRDRASGRTAVYFAFTVGLTLWLAFMIADEICVQYRLASVHVGLLVAQLVTLLALELLPEE